MPAIFLPLAADDLVACTATRMYSLHHWNSVSGRTVDLSFCITPTTTWFWSWGGLFDKKSHWLLVPLYHHHHHMNSITRKMLDVPPHQLNHRDVYMSRSHISHCEPLSCNHTKEFPSFEVSQEYPKKVPRQRHHWEVCNHRHISMIYLQCICHLFCTQ